MTKTFALALILAALPARLFAQTLAPADVRLAILGDPVHQVAWTDAALEKLKSIGFNAVQLNIAWGSRPFGEPLNLADVVTVPGEAETGGTAERRAELKRRVALAKKHGLRTLFHFGSPYANYDPYLGKPVETDAGRLAYKVDDETYDSWYDILNPGVRDHELALLEELRRQFPDVDDILVYTYDQHAWQTPEFQYTRFSFGIPLADRLPGYLAALHEVWTEGRAGKARLWWEPWELSAGQVYTMLGKLPRTDFGLMLHGNIGEVQLALPVDVWVRNTARMARDLGIPVVLEGFFASSSEEIEPLSIPAPRLVDEQYLAFTRIPGVVGIKEYFGIDTHAADLNLDLLQARLRAPALSTDELLTAITKRFGAAQAEVRAYLELLSSARQIYPWDASWLARQVGRASSDHGWSAATIRGVSWETPAWQSTRHARFMKTDTRQAHFWMLEDVALRCKLTADLLERARDVSASLIAKLNPGDKAQIERIQRDVEVFRRISRSYALHLRQTNVAQMLRQDLEAGRALTPALATELAALLEADVANQDGKGRVVEMRRLYRLDPRAFLRQYLLPSEAAPVERGHFTLTTR